MRNEMLRRKDGCGGESMSNCEPSAVHYMCREKKNENGQERRGEQKKQRIAKHKTSFTGRGAAGLRGGDPSLSTRCACVCAGLRGVVYYGKQLRASEETLETK